MAITKVTLVPNRFHADQLLANTETKIQTGSHPLYVKSSQYNAEPATIDLDLDGYQGGAAALLIAAQEAALVEQRHKDIAVIISVGHHNQQSALEIQAAILEQFPADVLVEIM